MIHVDIENKKMQIEGPYTTVFTDLTIAIDEACQKYGASHDKALYVIRSALETYARYKEEEKGAKDK